ncbi:hypothetical protein R6Q59_032177 [Mikania micrantha]
MEKITISLHPPSLLTVQSHLIPESPNPNLTDLLPSFLSRWYKFSIDQFNCTLYISFLSVCLSILRGFRISLSDGDCVRLNIGSLGYFIFKLAGLLALHLVTFFQYLIIG